MDLIIKCEKDDLNWSLMTLDQDEVQKTKVRDSVSDAEHIIARIKAEIISDSK